MIRAGKKVSIIASSCKALDILEGTGFNGWEMFPPKLYTITAGACGALIG